MFVDASQSAASPTLRALCRKHGGRIYIQHGQDLRRPQHPPRTYWLIFDHPLRTNVNFIRNATQIEKSWGMTPRLTADPRYRRTTDALALTYVLEGHGQFIDPSGPQTVRGGDLLTIFPGIPHVYGPAPGTRWNEIGVFFGGPIFEAWRQPGLLDPAHPVRRLEAIAYWFKRFHQALLPLAHSDGEPSPRDWARLVTLIAEMASTWRGTVSDPEAAWLDAARKTLLRTPYDATFNPAAAAHNMGLSERTFRRRFKALSGMSPSHYRMRCRIDSACRRLLESNEKIAVIASETGFANEYHFSRRFKQLTGTTPRAYRESHRLR